MNHSESKSPVLEGNDILFDCGQCGKSLAIDCRGAGLNIRCPHCDSELEVPIPDGFDLAELDKVISESIASDREISAQASDSPALASSDAAGEIARLRAELEAIRAQRQPPVYQNADLLKAIKAVNKQAEELRKALDDLAAMFEVRSGPEAETDETQKIV